MTDTGIRLGDAIGVSTTGLRLLTTTAAAARAWGGANNVAPSAETLTVTEAAMPWGLVAVPGPTG